MIVVAVCGMFLVSQLDAKFEQPMPEVQYAQLQTDTPKIVTDATPERPTDAPLMLKPAAPADNWAQIRAATAEAAAAASLQERDAIVPDGYYTQWSDLLSRCWATVAQGRPMDETGLFPLGDDSIDYTQSSRQKWMTEDRRFQVTLWLEYGNSDVDLGRRCWVKTTRNRLAADTVQDLKVHYDDWFASEKLSPVSVFQPYRWDLREGDQYHAAHTTFGSVQRCRMRVEYRDMVIASEAEATFYVAELTNEDCDLPSGASTNGVRVNRLPQIND